MKAWAIILILALVAACIYAVYATDLWFGIVPGNPNTWQAKLIAKEQSG